MNRNKNAILAKAMAVPKYRKAIASILTTPLRKRQDYTCIARKAFMIDILSVGDLPIYDRDPEIVGFAISDNGNYVEQVITKSDKFTCPLFDLATWVGVPLTKLRERKYDLRSRIMSLTKSEIFRIEDRKAFALMKAAMTANAQNIITVAAGSTPTLENYLDAMAIVEGEGNVVANIFLHPKNFNVMRKAFSGKDQFVPFDVSSEMIKTGKYALFFGANVYVSREVSEDEIYFCAEPESFGVCSIGMDLTVTSADKPWLGQVGYSVAEQLGFYIHHAKTGLASVRIAH